jgi:hypothetical protein
MKNPKTLEVLSCPLMTGDLWDELQKDINPLKKLLYFEENKKYTLRLLGPFMQVSRIYNPQSKLITEYDIDVRKLASKDREYFEYVSKRIQGLIKRYKQSKKFLELGKFVANVYKNMGFYKCIVTNSYIKSGEGRNEPKVKLVAMTYAMCKEIIQKVPEASTKIAGFHAKDITVIRRGSGLITRYEIDIDKESFLPEDAVQKILSQGLVDIPELLNAINKRNGAFYYQFQSDQYRMPEDLMNTLFKDLNKAEESRHLNRANEKINTVPRSAFERANRTIGPINSLELD